MFENKKLLVIAIAVVMFGFLIMPVSAIGNVQTITATQIGSGNIQYAANINNGGSGVTQTIIANQGSNTISSSGNTQILVNYNPGGDAVQTINAGQIGNNNFQFMMNYKPFGSPLTQSISNYQIGNFNRYVKINYIG